MSNVLGHTQQQQVLALGRLGWTLSRIQAATGVRRETISGYLKAAGIPVRGRGRPSESKPKPAISAAAVSTELPSKPAISGEVSTDSSPPPPAILPAAVSTDSGAVRRPGGAPSASACEPYRALIVEALGRGRNARAIWQDLVDDHGFPARYASVRRFVRTLSGTSSPDARVVITTTAGDEAQVDYGDGPMVRQAPGGKYRRTRLFVLPPDVYEPTLNPQYRDVLAHYGVVGLPCRVRDPDRKGKVESGIGHTQKTPLHGQRFESLEQAQAYLDRWERHWADTRIHGTTKRQVAAMFAEEQPALQPLPLEPFRYYRFGVRAVHLDGCVEVEAAYYSTPPGWIGQRLPVQWTEGLVRLLDPKSGLLLREHVRAPRGHHRIAEADRPARTPATTVVLLERARHAGPHLHTICTYIHDHDGAAGVRRILGVLALAKKYGPAVADDAAKAALDLQVPTYHFLKRYLARRPPVPLTLTQINPLIRQLTLYRELIDQQTGDSE